MDATIILLLLCFLEVNGDKSFDLTFFNVACVSDAALTKFLPHKVHTHTQKAKKEGRRKEEENAVFQLQFSSGKKVVK